jgi:hypothetical protein
MNTYKINNIEHSNTHHHKNKLYQLDPIYYRNKRLIKKIKII